jgi:parvulin-like peptidyl-prolyl isomerase
MITRTTVTALSFVAIAILPLCRPAALAATAPDTTIATVGGEPIHAEEANLLLAKVTRGKKIAPEALPYAKAQVLEELIARRLILAHGQRSGAAPDEAAVEKARAKLRTQLAAQRKTLADYCKALGIAEVDLDRHLAWNLLWEKYLQKYLTKARMETYFENHRRDLDGTQLSVSHILLKASPGQPIEDVVKRAEGIRRDITAGKLSFAEAAKKYSEGPSRADGGKLGLIGRRGPMDELFSLAAFVLEPKQISEPVKTTFGVHLIRCDEVKPGTKQLADVRREVEEALDRELLEKLAAAERRTTPVKYTAAWPHFKPGTHELDD